MMNHNIKQESYKILDKQFNIIMNDKEKVSEISIKDTTDKGRSSISRDIITEHMQIEEFQNSEFILKKSQKIAHVGHWEWFPKTNKLIWSDEMFNIFGITKDEFDKLGTDLDKIIDKTIHPDDIKKVRESNKKVKLEGLPPPLEYRVIWPDGTIHTVWAEPGEKIINETGDIIKLFGIVQDITERKQIENKLRKSEENLKHAQRVARVGNWEWDITTGKITWSEETFHLHGIDPKQREPTYEELLKYYYPEDVPNFRRAVDDVIKNGTPYTVVCRIILPDGSFRYLEGRGEAIYDNKGDIIKLFGTSMDITEYVHVVDKLRNSENRFRTSVENMLDAFGIYSAIRDSTGHIEDFKIEFINDAACKSNMMTRDEQIGKHLCELLPSHKKTGLFDEYCQVVETCKPLRKESIKFEDIYGKKFMSRIFDISATKLNDGFAASWRDITERKFEEKELLRLQSLLNETQKIAKVGGWEYDIEKKMITWTDEVYNMYGVSKDFDPNNIDNNIGFYSPNGQPIIKNAFDKAVNYGEPYDLELELDSAKGQHLWVRTMAKPVMCDGNVIRIVGNIIDITDQKRIEQTLRLHGEIIKNMSEGVCLISSSDQKIVYTNPKFEKMFGYDTGEMIGKNVSIVNAPTEKTAEETAKQIIEILNRTGEWYGEIENIKKDGTRFWCYASCSLFDHNGYGKVIVAVHTDITERKNTDEKLNNAYKDLERSNKELEQFAYVASHDLQEPLRTIYGYVELLESNYKDKLDSDAKDFMTYIISGAKRMQQMINDLLALSRITTRGKEFLLTDVERTLKIVIENLQSLISKNQAIITYDPMPIIMADDSQIIQLFQNLIDNAIKFRRKETPKIHISYKKQYNEHIFSIKDNGIGIDKNKYKKLFIIFQRLHSIEEYPGTGIGLAMAKKIVERHGGRIWVESEVEIGSTFYFTIPVRLRSTNVTKIN